jgi:hypothetical protein
VKFSDQPSRQVYLAVNETLYPIANPDTMEVLGLTWDQIIYIMQNDAARFKYGATLDLYASPATVEQFKNEIISKKSQEESVKHRDEVFSHWNTSVFTATLSARYDAPDFLVYNFSIKMIRSCDMYSNISLSKSDAVNSYLRARYGPDEMVLFVEGPVLQAFVPAHQGCSMYTALFQVPIEGS